MHYYSESIPVETMTAERLDQLLALGWYRMSDKFFTTSFIKFGEEIYNTVWLRIALADFSLSPTLSKIKKRNQGFRIVYQPLTVDDEMEVLFASYKTVAKFETATSLDEHLYSKSSFHDLSYCVKIYDDDLLIGCGIYERGIDTLEGLISFYHADYHKYSLGKYLILTKIEHAISLGCTHYYLGYYVPGYPKFDYKLSFSDDCTEFYHPGDNHWYVLTDYDDYYDEVGLMYRALDQKCEALHFEQNHFLT
jgi:leucyl-tRNA---protein transferase